MCQHVYLVCLCCLREIVIFFTWLTSHFEQEWNITTLSFEEDPEPFGKERDSAIQMLAKEAGIEVIVRTSHTLYDLQKYVQIINFWVNKMIFLFSMMLLHLLFF